MPEPPAWYHDPDLPGRLSLAERLALPDQSPLPDQLALSDQSPLSGSPSPGPGRDVDTIDAPIDDGTDHAPAHPTAAQAEGISVRTRPTRVQASPSTRSVLVAAAMALLALTVTVEVAGRVLIERVAAAQLRSAGVAGDVDVTVGAAWWYPTITRLLATRTLDAVRVELAPGRTMGLPVGRVRYSLHDLRVSLSPLARTVRIVSVGHTDVLVAIDTQTMSEALGVGVAIRDGQLFIWDSLRPARVQVDGTQLSIVTPDLVPVVGTDRVSFPVSDAYLLPCAPVVGIRGSAIELRCTATRMPGILEPSIGPAAGPTKGESDTPTELGPSDSVVTVPDPPAGTDSGSGRPGGSGD